MRIRRILTDQYRKIRLIRTIRGRLVHIELSQSRHYIGGSDLKRTRRIEIVRYTRRLTNDDADAKADAEYKAAISALSMALLDAENRPFQAEDSSDIHAETGAAAHKRRWFNFDWLKRG